MKPDPFNLDPVPGIADGAYLLDSVIKTVGDETFSLKRDQLKIFVDNRFMFAFFDDQTGLIDAATGYAYWVDGVLTETPIANQDGPVEGLSFEIALQTTEAGFTQGVRGMPAESGGTYDLDEQWALLSSEKNPFDGLWKLESRETAGDSCTDFTEMKLIGGGHTIFFHRYNDGGEDDGELVKHFGFGSLQVSETGEVTETGMTGTIEGYAGSEQLLGMELVEEDRMVQRFLVDGVEVVQVYGRI